MMDESEQFHSLRIPTRPPQKSIHNGFLSPILRILLAQGQRQCSLLHTSLLFSPECGSDYSCPFDPYSALLTIFWYPVTLLIIVLATNLTTGTSQGHSMCQIFSSQS